MVVHKGHGLKSFDQFQQGFYMYVTVGQWTGEYY